MKGVDTFVASIMLVLITIVASVLISGWLSNVTSTNTNTISNNTKTQLQCQYADAYIQSAVYDCARNCTQGDLHTLNLTVVNSGRKELSFSTIYLRNTTGYIIELTTGSPTILAIGDSVTFTNVTRTSCSGINGSIEYITITSTNCPTNAYDNLAGSDVTYQNC